MKREIDKYIMDTKIKEETDDFLEVEEQDEEYIVHEMIAEHLEDIYAGNIILDEPKPEVPLFVLYNLPNEVTTNPLESKKDVCVKKRRPEICDIPKSVEDVYTLFSSKESSNEEMKKKEYKPKPKSKKPRSTKSRKRESTNSRKLTSATSMKYISKELKNTGSSSFKTSQSSQFSPEYQKSDMCAIRASQENLLSNSNIPFTISDSNTGTIQCAKTENMSEPSTSQTAYSPQSVTESVQKIVSQYFQDVLRSQDIESAMVIDGSIKYEIGPGASAKYSKYAGALAKYNEDKCMFVNDGILINKERELHSESLRSDKLYPQCSTQSAMKKSVPDKCKSVDKIEKRGKKRTSAIASEDGHKACKKSAKAQSKPENIIKKEAANNSDRNFCMGENVLNISKYSREKPSVAANDHIPRRGRKKKVSMPENGHNEQSIAAPNTDASEKRKKSPALSKNLQTSENWESGLSKKVRKVSNRKPNKKVIKKEIIPESQDLFPLSAIRKTNRRVLKPKIFHCEHCPSAFSRRDYLRLHIMLHTNERPHKCEVCGKGFRMRWRLRLHLAAHFDDRRHVCQVCSYRAVRKDTLRYHMIHIHKRTNICEKKECIFEHDHG